MFIRFRLDIALHNHILHICTLYILYMYMYRYIMNEYGITVDRRHLLLLSDVMTFKGMVGIVHI